MTKKLISFFLVFPHFEKLPEGSFRKLCSEFNLLCVRAVSTVATHSEPKRGRV